ncbi:hypothetical protein [Vibrio quintilis]|uniref:Uncharacterized protein n=1 Tax=Vibrio quintilis TaxID=1117707 RepID=A0A1M7YR41_9VIBR|nr:hypothetical protein [Vibrio quintilis]SHO55102.1 hypothetical protein VQ7734_00821 [Vibrio quintilis]
MPNYSTPLPTIDTHRLQNYSTRSPAKSGDGISTPVDIGHVNASLALVFLYVALARLNIVMSSILQTHYFKSW